MMTRTASSNNSWSAKIARGVLRLFGWRVEGQLPAIPKYVLIGAPHTSYWDFPVMMLVAATFNVRLRWMGKHTAFRPPLGWLARALGGIAVDRTRRNNLVEQMIERFQTEREFVLVIPPEGSRKKTQAWKSGFYHIARGAAVPVVCGFVDFKRKISGVGPTLMLTGNMHADMDVIRAFYTGFSGLYPDQAGNIRLEQE